MIIRKPYAFLIKNFKKIHIFILVLCGYIFIKNSQTRSFVSEFINLGSYDAYNEPISRYISFILIITLLVVIILLSLLVILLRHKNKPWKLYLIPVLEYSYMLIVFIITKNYFNNYDGSGSTTGIRAIRDLLTIASIFQYPIFIILFIRIFGVDLNKFNFKMDKEYLELDSRDREEFEISIDIDKESFRRTYKRFFRNVNYIYVEHKFLINSIVTCIFLIFIIYSYNYIFILHKSYKEGDVLNTSGYTITINNSYFTNKDYRGNIISKDSNFVIINLDIKNNVGPRKINFSRFHIMNGISNYSYTSKTYETDFNDLGKVYAKKEFKRDEKINLIMIFKVDKKLNKDKFVLYYQELDGDKSYLRKIKLNIEDISEVELKDTKSIGEELVLKEGRNDKDINIEQFEIGDNFSYSHQDCVTSRGCVSTLENIINKEGEKILKIEFVSDSFEGKDLIDFSTKYGKINYIDDKGSSKVIEVKNAVLKKYLGQYIYVRVPVEIEASNNIELVYTVRNNQYIYKLK